MQTEALNDFHREMIQKSIEIKASAQTIWKVLLEDFKAWSNAFKEGSRVETDWKPKSKIKFIGPQGNAIIGQIQEHRPEEELAIKFTALLIDGREDTESDEARRWIGGMENYFLTAGENDCILTIEEDVPVERLKELKSEWNQALFNIKQLAEGRELGS